MPSGPVVAAIVLVIAVLVGGVYLYLELRHHGGARVRDRQRGGERLPLFGTDLLVEHGTAPRHPIVAPRTPPAPAARATAERPEPARPSARDFAPPAAVPIAVAQQTPPAPFRAVPAPERAPAPAFASAGAATLVATPAARAAGVAPNGAANGAHDADGSYGGSPAPHGAGLVPGDRTMHDGETVRFAIPDEGTLQFLPGRLEIVSGPDRGRDVRFVRTGAEAHPEITFGRSEGSAYRHVQLMARTVSRQHAAMSLIDGHWQLKNLSATNPVLLNGRSLEAGEVAPLLVEGDRIEMGEIVFLFHDR